MKKKLLGVIALAGACICSAFGFAACDGGENPPANGCGDGNHVYGAWETTQQPTCSATGKKAQTCTACGDVKQEDIPATGVHSYGEWQTVAQPGCISKGSQQKVCSGCNDTITEDIPATGVHSYGEWQTVTQLTCMQPGVQERTCECGDKQTQDVYPQDGQDVHDFGEWNVTSPATCSGLGFRYRQCNLCMTTQEEEIPATGTHVYGAERDYEFVEGVYNYDAQQHVQYCKFCGTAKEEAHSYADNFCVCGMEEYTEGLQFYTHYSEGCFVRGFENATATEVIIPSNYMGTPVVKVDTAAFAQNTTIQTVKLPSTIKSIESNAFAGCTSLTDIVLPEGLEKIASGAFSDSGIAITQLPSTLKSVGLWAFYGCQTTQRDGFTFVDKWLIGRDLEFEGATVNVPAGTVGIADSAFQEYSTLTTLVLPDSVKHIGENAFFRCTNLSSVTWSSAIETVGKQCFWLNAFGGELNLPAVKEIGEDAFYTAKITKLTIGESCKTISDYAFQGCSELKEVSIASADVIGEWAFTNCSKMTKLTLGAGVKEIQRGAFGYLAKLSTVTFTEGLETIGNAAFVDCAIETLNLPGSIVSISNSAFQNNKNLTTITVTNPQEDGYYVEGNTLIFDGTAVLLTDTSVLPTDGSVTSIGINAASCCTEMQTFSIPASVAYINSWPLCASIVIDAENPNYFSKDGIAYKRTTNGNEFVCIPQYLAGDVELAEVDVIPRSAFRERTELTSVTLHCSTVLDYAFYGCSKLATVNGLSAVTSIDYDSFAYCTSLREVNLSGLTEVAYYAFYGCSSLYRVTFGLELETIQYNAFTHCGLTEIVLPKSLKSIGSDAFLGNDDVMTVFYSGSIEEWTLINFGNRYSNPLNGASRMFVGPQHEYVSEIEFDFADIPSYIFYGYVGLQKVTLGATVETIGDYTFYGCSGLTEITFGDEVTTIGDGAFANSGLVKVTLGAKVADIGYGAFENCDKLVEVYDLSNEISVSKGSDNKGYIGKYAKVVHTDAAEESIIVKSGDFLFIKTNEENYLIAYTGINFTVTLPASFEDAPYAIYKYAFYNRRDISAVNFGTGVTSIGTGAFKNCSNIIEIEIPDTLTTVYLNSETFMGCTSLTKVTLPENIIQLTQYTFKDCFNLTDINLEHIKIIDSQVFAGCSKISTVEDGVTYVDGWVVSFSLAEGKNSFVLKSGIVGIAENIFGHHGLNTVYFEGTETELNAAMGRMYGNTYFESATKYFYSEDRPQTEGNFWHYDTDGVTPVVWTQE